MLVVSASAIRMVEELAIRARREGYGRLSAFAHDPAFFVRRGFSIVPHTWVPEKIAHDCNACPLFRNCGQYAIVLELDRASVARSSNLRRTRRRTVVAPPMSKPAPDRGRRHRTVGFSRQRPALRHQGQRQARPVADRQRCAGDRRRRVHGESRQGGAALPVRRITWRRAAACARAIVTNSGCANACTGPQGMADAARWRSSPRRRCRLQRASRAGRVDRRHRRQPEDGQDPRRHSAGGGRRWPPTAAPPPRARS